MKRLLVKLVLLGSLAGCVVPDAPIKPGGDPNYSVSETIAQTMDVAEGTADAFTDGMTGGGVVGGAILAAVFLFNEIRRRRKEQEDLIKNAN